VDRVLSVVMVRPRGRPRDASADARILAAALEALASVGYQALSVDDVASTAGVAKTTVYRRWPTKEQLVVSCLQEVATRRSPAPTGDWREDVRRAVKALILEVNTPEGKAWNSVLAAAQNNPDLHISLSRHDEPVVRLRDALREGVERGELRSDLDIDLTMDLLAGVIPWRTLVLREPIAPALADSIVDIILDGARVADAQPSRRPKPRPATRRAG